MDAMTMPGAAQACETCDAALAEFEEELKAVKARQRPPGSADLGQAFLVALDRVSPRPPSEDELSRSSRQQALRDARRDYDAVMREIDEARARYLAKGIDAIAPRGIFASYEDFYRDLVIGCGAADETTSDFDFKGYVKGYSAFGESGLDDPSVREILVMDEMIRMHLKDAFAPQALVEPEPSRLQVRAGGGFSYHLGEENYAVAEIPVGLELSLFKSRQLLVQGAGVFSVGGSHVERRDPEDVFVVGGRGQIGAGWDFGKAAPEVFLNSGLTRFVRPYSIENGGEGQDTFWNANVEAEARYHGLSLVVGYEFAAESAYAGLRYTRELKFGKKWLPF